MSFLSDIERHVDPTCTRDSERASTLAHCMRVAVAVQCNCGELDPEVYTIWRHILRIDGTYIMLEPHATHTLMTRLTWRSDGHVLYSAAMTSMAMHLVGMQVWLLSAS